MKHLTNRNYLMKKEIVDNNQEFDFLTFPDLWFNDEKKKSNESTYVVTDETVTRPDLISYYVYGTSSLWWLICSRNKIINPLTELTVGMVLYIPSLSDYYDFVNKNTKATKKTDLKFATRKF